MRIWKDWNGYKNWLETVGWCYNWCRKSSWTILNPIQAGRAHFDCKIQQEHTVGCSKSSDRGQIISGPNLNQPYHIGINASYPSEAIWGHLGWSPAQFLTLKALKANLSCSRSSARGQIISIFGINLISDSSDLSLVIIKISICGNLNISGIHRYVYLL